MFLAAIGSTLLPTARSGAAGRLPIVRAGSTDPASVAVRVAPASWAGSLHRLGLGVVEILCRAPRGYRLWALHEPSLAGRAVLSYGARRYRPSFHGRTLLADVRSPGLSRELLELVLPWNNPPPRRIDLWVAPR